MSYKNVLLIPLSFCPLLVIMGGFNRQNLHTAPLPQTSFVAKSIRLEPELANLAPTALWLRAAALIAPEKISWLRVKTWQKQTCEDASFEAEGVLTRGPHHCVRLDMTIQTGNQTSTVVTVSDGIGMAHICGAPNTTAEITSQRFLTPAGQPMTEAAIDELLNSYGCGGPFCQLRSLQPILENMQMETGTWKEKPVIQFTGSIKENAPSFPGIHWCVPPRACRVFLDARTLWPHRIEWWSVPEFRDVSALVLEVEFREPEINQPLSHEECVRAFTYTPE